jgi:hypothetical protein
MLEKNIKIVVAIAVGVLTLGFVVGQYRQLTAPTPANRLADDFEQMTEEMKKERAK